jgi:hypothetical protein
MPFSIPEALADLPALLALVQKIEAGVIGLPAQRTAKVYSDLICSLLPDLATLVDQIEAQVKS